MGSTLCAAAPRSLRAARLISLHQSSASRVAISTYYAAESGTTVMPYYNSLGMFSGGTAAWNAYDYVILGGTMHARW